MTSLQKPQLIFKESKFTQNLKAEPKAETDLASRQVLNAHFSFTKPTPVKDPQIICWSESLSQQLGLGNKNNEFSKIFSGNLIPPNFKPFSARYGGHQFGHWAGQLGDGRAITLGEIGDFEIQLKGAGPTPYSRTADGRAVLRSSVREFVCSEAMFGLGIPTTRALSLVTTGETVVRDMFYDGNPKDEDSAIVCRVAPSFIRFGNFEILTAQNEIENLKKLAHFTIENYFSEFDLNSKDVYQNWFNEICIRTAKLISQWQGVGFVHGVMNTDNMSILGLTIDYGPYGWLDTFEPGWTPNTTDFREYRYRYENQPNIALWNLSRLAWALSPLKIDPEVGLKLYKKSFTFEYEKSLKSKLGLLGLSDEDLKLVVSQLFRLLQIDPVDPTLFFRKLSGLTEKMKIDDCIEILKESFYLANPTKEFLEQLCQWLKKYTSLLDEGDKERVQNMNLVNPLYICRNYLTQIATEKILMGDLQYIERLNQVLRQPYTEQPGFEEFAQKRPDWAKNKPGCSTLSCSS